MNHCRQFLEAWWPHRKSACLRIELSLALPYTCTPVLINNNSDFCFVSEATVEINKVAHHINENIRQRENFQKMLSIQNSLTGEGAPKILAPGKKNKGLMKIDRKLKTIFVLCKT